MSDNQEAFRVFKKILVYCVFIIFAPISTFFVSKFFIFQGLFDVNSINSNIWSAIFAVVVLHLALGTYVYNAYFETSSTKPEVKVD